MRTFLVASLASLGLTASANAADWAPPAQKWVAPAFTWTGFYIGANAGYIRGDGSLVNGCPGPDFLLATNPPNLTVVVPCNASRSLSPETSGWLAGAQAGYNQQIGAWVFGFEADFQGTDLNRNGNAFAAAVNPRATFPVFDPFTNAETYRASAEIDWFGTVRGRIGFAWDRLLVYGTGGAIFANVTTSHFLDRAFLPATFAGFPGPTNLTSIGSHDAIVPGWIAGGGVEYAFWNNVSIKVEGMYYELQKTHAGGREIPNFNILALGLNAGNVVTTDIKHHGFLVRGGINWRFYGIQ
jgi:outer membrane immunogenic protein